MDSFNRIENASDQLHGYAQEVEKVVSEFVELGYSKDQSIKIVKMAIEDMKVDAMYEKNEAIFKGLTNQNLRIESEDK
ncbi:hypothetical protein SR42_09705 [Clostridium botulinum]|uniref:Phage protein n=1 Tax=Clostridium botulinum TaxID=1491 RepID=A0A6M0WT57_CLOBO|nr:hypothetical protein SR42_09705 [Clostridium botulinum]MBN1070471.1 hypothetical protein [Clostridium botulinum]MBY6932930.1 hypothetical protein [Clostridium botulinum]NFE59134.1 hypothetical protein [Clostridium botulinum]NFE84567.1 hypothetical protein [Clostridium botulinum]